MSWKRKGKLAFLLFLAALFLGACGENKEQEQKKTYKVYYVNNDETGIFYREYATDTTDTKALIEELLDQLALIPEKLEYKAPISGNVSLLDYTLTEDQLTLSFDAGYKEMPVTTEVLARAAIVRTLTQIEGVQYVSFLIRSEPLTDAYGTVLGIMNADMFIDNAGNEISTYEKVKLTLYLANESGSGLRAVNRTVVYNSNISMERLVLEQILAGPLEGENAFPVINPGTRIVSVNVRDGICYVDFDSTFLTQIYNVTSGVAIYSLTNSLVELPNVNKVQISVDGNTNIVYKENVNLTTVFERNLDLVE